MLKMVLVKGKGFIMGIKKKVYELKLPIISSDNRTIHMHFMWWKNDVGGRTHQAWDEVEGRLCYVNFVINNDEEGERIDCEY